MSCFCIGQQKTSLEMFRPSYVFLSESNMTTGKSKFPKCKAMNDIKQHTSLLALKAATLGFGTDFDFIFQQ